MVKKGFFKRNWDIISAYSIFILGFLIMMIALSGCSGYGCLGFVIIPIIGAGIYNVLLFVGIWRTWKIKQLSRIRWFWILIPMAIGTLANIFALVGNSGFGVTFFLALLSPLAIILFSIKFLGAGGSTFSIIGNEVVSNVTITEFEDVLKQFPYLETGVKQLIMKNGGEVI